MNPESDESERPECVADDRGVAERQIEHAVTPPPRWRAMG